MSSSSVDAKAASTFPDGTKDYVPLRGKTSAKIEAAKSNKPHISDLPITWSNWYQHINWLNTTLIVIIPIIGFVSAYWVPLQLYTALWAVLYYFNTGLGITAGKWPLPSRLLLNWRCRVQDNDAD